MLGKVEAIAARFHDRADADEARKRIEALGYEPAEISYIIDPGKCSLTFDAPGSHWAKSTLFGLGSGAAAGAVAGAATAIFTSGSIVFLGPVVAAIAAGVGAFDGLMSGLSMDSDAAKACETAVHAGALVMIVQTHPGDDGRVREILGYHIIGVEAIDR